MRFYLFSLFFLAVLAETQAQNTYCNPINIDYGFTPIPNFSEWGKHRATADPVIVMYKNDFYLFSTNQWGYWWSPDLANWHFVSRHFLKAWHKVYDDLCAPAVGIIGDTMLVFGSTYSNDFPIWMSTNPKGNEWTEAVEKFDIGGWDPAFFADRISGKLYMYNGSSNRYPLYGVELNRKTLQPMGARKELFLLEPDRYGWQRFGEHLDNTFLDPFVEGAEMTEYKGRYYLQFGAPGTEFSSYSDGVAIGDTPLGPFTLQSDPLSSKMGGFARGAGHGATFQDRAADYWHVSTIRISVKNNFERRLGIWPAGFDKDGVMYCNTAFGDYPYYLPGAGEQSGKFTGWMLLNYNKPVQASSSMAAHPANNAVDENIQTYWSAETGNAGEWFQTDLGRECSVNAIQINYADQDAEVLGKRTDLYHQYQIFCSRDGKKWELLVDKQNNKTDVPHDYVELTKPVKTRYLRLENKHIATGKFALCGFRIFGHGGGNVPAAPRDFLVLRTEKDKRSAWLKWAPGNDAWAWNIRYGTAPDKLYTSILVYGANEYWLKTLDNRKDYYFTLEAVNENGVSVPTEMIKSE